MSEGRGEDPIKANAARVSRFLLGRKRYQGRERIMAVDGYQLNHSDLEALVDFVQSCKPEIAAKSSHGSINSIPGNDPAWMASNEVMVKRHVTDWVEVTHESVG